MSKETEEFIEKIKKAKRRGVTKVLVIRVEGSNFYEHNLEDWESPIIGNTAITYRSKHGGMLFINPLSIKYILDVKTSII